MTAPLFQEKIIEYASVSRRLTCIVYETLLVLGIVFIAALLYNLMSLHTFLGQNLNVKQLQVPAGVVRYGLQVWLFLVMGFYFVWVWTKKAGQTLPMRTWKLRIITIDNRVLTWQIACLRYVAAVISISSFGIGLLWAFFDKDKLFLHDRLCHTKIVHEISPKKIDSVAEQTD